MMKFYIPFYGSIFLVHYSIFKKGCPERAAGLRVRVRKLKRASNF